MAVYSTDRTSFQAVKRLGAGNYIKKYVLPRYVLYLFLAPTLIYIIVFQYFPLYGLQIAFKNFLAVKGIWGSPWVGFKHFQDFLSSYHFLQLLKNTLGISLYGLIVGIPLPIILALALNYSPSHMLKKTIQTITYAPHFISTVVMAGIIMIFLSPRTGIVNNFIQMIGAEPVFFMGKAEWFKTVYVLSDVWQHTGWGSIIYIATLAGVSYELHEAAIMDGASKLNRIWHIDIPSILPTFIILTILNMGKVMNVGFEKVYLLQNSLNISSSEIISTYTYKIGLLNANYSFGAAIGLFNNAINFILLMTVNKMAKKLTETSLW